VAKKISPKKSPDQKPIHPWRICPLGQFYRNGGIVRTYTQDDGKVIHQHPRRGGCVHSRSGKDFLYPEEIKEISKNYFNSRNLKRPCPNNSKGTKSDLYDDLIAGWTQYWNDIFNPKIPLDPNFVKALIESESSLSSNPDKNKMKSSDPAFGLMQVRNSTRKILANQKGEIKDHYIVPTNDDLLDPDVNICVGIRWLFQKQKLASSSLGENADWNQTLIKYKGLNLNSKRDQVIYDRFQNIYRAYQKCIKK
jgi:hypothetical protein